MGTTILIVGVALSLFLLVIGLIVSSRDQKSFVEDRLGQYLEEEDTIGEGDRATPVTDWLNVQAGRTAYGKGLSSELARADIKLRAGEYIAVLVITTTGGILIGWFLGGRQIPSALPTIILGALVGFFGPRFYVRREQGRRLVRFDGQLADMLSLMVNGLRAGYSTMQAMEAVSKELPPPISEEFRRVVQEMQLGVPMEATLDNLMRRIPSRDLDLVVTAINVQREVGGNLAEILDTISHTIRERVRVKGEIRVLTSQVMMSGRFLAVMPVILIGVMYFINRSYMMNFFNEETRSFGIPALVIGGIMIIIGYYSMTRIADIEV
jgi:tight adherence protein B